MDTDTFVLSKRAVNTSLGMLLWITTPVGLVLILNESYGWGVLLSGIGLAAIGLLLSGRAAGAYATRRISRSRGYFMAIGFGMSTVLTASYTVTFFQSAVGVNLLGVAYAITVALVGFWAVAEVVRSIKQQPQPNRSTSQET